MRSNMKFGCYSISYDDAVEEALCYGWTDIMVRRVGQNSYAQRFTPRKPRSRWSESNLARMKRVIEEKRVARAGMDAYEKRSSQMPQAAGSRERTNG